LHSCSESLAISAFIDLTNISKTQTKDLKEILRFIQERMSSIQIQMEDNHTRQIAIEAHNSSIQSTLTFLMNQIPSTNHDENTGHTLVTPITMATNKLSLTAIQWIILELLRI